MLKWGIIYFASTYPINGLQLDMGQRTETTWVSLISSNSSTVNDPTAMPWLSDHYIMIYGAEDYPASQSYGIGNTVIFLTTRSPAGLYANGKDNIMNR